MNIYHGMRERIRKLFEGTRILTVIGGYWGDEGKGKIIDAVASVFDIVARYSGGCNAGHTVFTDSGIKVVSHLIPCGIAQNKPCVLGPGVFFDVDAFINELDEAKTTLGTENLPAILIDPNCPVRTPYHTLLESWLEFCRGKGAINTTNKAIGPLAGLDALRLGIRVGDLFESKKAIEAKIFNLFKSLEPILAVMRNRHHEFMVPNPDFVTHDLISKVERLDPYVSSVSEYLRRELNNGAKILAEGAQSVGLDRSFGTYPYVSSGMSTNLGAPQGLGIAPKYFDKTLLVAKALPTRVGAGSFPTEIWDRDAAQAFPKDRPDLFDENSNGHRSEFLKELLEGINNGTALNSDRAKYYQVLGDEVGATTRRGRSVGNADWVWLRYAVETTSADLVALTRIDMLTGVNRISYAASYQRSTDRASSLGGDPTRGNIAPVYDYLPGWNESIGGVTEWDALPLAAQGYVNRLEECLGGVPVSLIGTSPNRDGLIVR